MVLLKAGGKPSTWFPPGRTRRAGCFTLNFLLITRTADQLEHLIDHHIRQRHPNPPSNPPRTDPSRFNAACVQLALAIPFPPHFIHPHLVPFSPLPLPVQRKWPVRLVTSVRFGPEWSQMGSKRNYIITITPRIKNLGSSLECKEPNLICTSNS